MFKFNYHRSKVGIVSKFIRKGTYSIYKFDSTFLIICILSVIAFQFLYFYIMIAYHTPFLIIFEPNYLFTIRSGRDKRKQAAVHLQEMEIQMQEAEKQIAEEKRINDQDLPIKEEIATPGSSTPRKTPQRLGL